MEYSFYQIRTLSNTHVGSGQSSYGIVDNIVQKDYLNQMPCINSTSLKGALKEWVEKKLKKVNEAKTIFGDANETIDGVEVETKQNKPGTHYFFQAFMLSYPMRSDKVQYFNVTCPTIIDHFKELLKIYRITTFDKVFSKLQEIKVEENRPISFKKIEGAIVEKHSIKTIKSETLGYDDEIIKLFGNNLVIMHNNDFKNIVKKLPVITRNNLENGQSTNLFYEEVVPRETFFGFFIGYEKTLTTLFDEVIKNEHFLQIGANATVGYGFSELNKLN